MKCTKLLIVRLLTQLNKLISQIDQKGAEGQLEKTFADVVTSFPSPFVKYELLIIKFDFVSIC